jgi:hypothetical protein
MRPSRVEVLEPFAGQGDHGRLRGPAAHTDVAQRDFRYRVAVTLSRIRLCGDRRHYYTRIRTRFLTRAPSAVRRLARPPATAGCLA